VSGYPRGVFSYQRGVFNYQRGCGVINLLIISYFLYLAIAKCLYLLFRDWFRFFFRKLGAGYGALYIYVVTRRSNSFYINVLISSTYANGYSSRKSTIVL
jgi:hypothetical protein